MDRRYRIPGGQRDDLTAPKEKNGVGDDQQRISLEVNQGSKCLFDLLAVAGFQNMRLEPDGASTRLDIRRLLGLTSRPTLAALGTSSRNNSRRFAPSGPARTVTPVALTPGRLRLSTRPDLTGSEEVVK